jgi:ABC-2 type transport system permease protein
VSSWAKSKPLVWALGLPLITTAVLKFVTQVNRLDWNIDWFIKNILMRGVDGVFPGIWLGYDDVSRVDLVGAHQVPALATVARLSWQTLSSPHALVGAAVGVAMIVAAVRVRRWRDEG